MLGMSVLAACSSGSAISPSIAPDVLPLAPAASAVTITAVYGTTRLANIRVGLYIGKQRKSCLPLPGPCFDFAKTLATGVTAKNGRAILDATFSNRELICAAAYHRTKKQDSTVYTCDRHFPSAIALQFNPASARSL
jgi:hypothetical protein